MSIEEFFLLFQRGVVALEQLANRPVVHTSVFDKMNAEQNPTTAQLTASAVVAEAVAVARRPRKAKTETPAATEPAVKVVAVVHDEVLVEETAPEEFEDAVEETPVPTIDDMRSALRAYQMATSPTEAMKLLSTFSGATTLTKVPEGERAAMVKAALAGAGKKTP